MARWRIEHSESLGGYYFYNHHGENIRLETGMRARVRRVPNSW